MRAWRRLVRLLAGETDWPAADRVVVLWLTLCACAAVIAACRTVTGFCAWAWRNWP